MSQEICDLLEIYLCECLSYGPKHLREWWSDGVVHLEISHVEPNQFKLLGVTWIGSLGFAPFDINVELAPSNEANFVRTVVRIGTLDRQCRPEVFSVDIPPRRVLESRPMHNRDWAMAIELTPPT